VKDLASYLPVILQTVTLVSLCVGGYIKVMRQLDRACSQIEQLREMVSTLNGRVDTVNARVDLLFITQHKEGQ
jgi:hypothetical protein